MAEPPGQAPGNDQYVACPCCTIQIPVGTRICPHCRLEVPEGARQQADKRIAKVFRSTRAEGGGSSLPEIWSAYGKWVLAAAPVLLEDSRLAALEAEVLDRPFDVLPGGILHEHRPDVRRILTSACTPPQAFVEYPPRQLFLKKPFGYDELKSLFGV